MSIHDLSENAQNYLKVIWSLQEWSDVPVTTTAVAERCGVRVSTASGAITRLADLGLVSHERYGTVSLTDAGHDHAVAMVRRHRLIETMLVELLGYRWDQVHDEAETLEHAVSDFMIERIDKVLGHPRRDPHGDPIPDATGRLDMPRAVQLSETAAGDAVVVERISDADPAMLQHFADHGLVVGARAVVGAGEPYAETTTLALDGAGTLSLGRSAAEAVWVSNATSSPSI